METVEDVFFPAAATCGYYSDTLWLKKSVIHNIVITRFYSHVLLKEEH